MIQSYYNVVSFFNDSVFVYNTLTSAFLKIPEKQWKSLSEDSDKDFLGMLYRQGILVDNHQTEINKYKYFYYRKAFDEQVLDITIAPTMRCNFNCSYCFEGDNKSFSKMSAEVENAIIQYIVKKSNRREVNISWFGGEPLLAFDKILSISSRLDTAKVEFRANIITNGSLLREDIIEKLPSLHLTHIQISLDGLSHEHDKTRHYKNGQPSFVDIESGIKRLLSNTAIKVSLRVGVDNTHPKSYLDVYTYMKKKYPKAVENGQLQIGANVIQDRTGFDNGSNCFSDRQLYEKDLFDFENENVRQFRPSLPGLNMPCMYKTPASLAIDSHGFIYPCLEYLGNPSKSIGNVIKGELSFSKQANLLFNDSVFDDKVCLSCNVFPICGGGCPKDRENHKDSPKTYCTYLKTYLADLLPYFEK